MARRLLATMITVTTYGSWLPGDLRGYVEDGRMLPHNARLLRHAEDLMTSQPVLLTVAEQGVALESLLAAGEEFDYRLWAVSIEAWHMHWLIDHGFDAVSEMVGRLKARIRRAVGRGRIWTKGYDKRFCFTQEEVEARMAYILRHRGARPLPAADWRVL